MTRAKKSVLTKHTTALTAMRKLMTMLKQMLISSTVSSMSCLLSSSLQQMTLSILSLTAMQMTHVSLMHSMTSKLHMKMLQQLQMTSS